MPKALTPAQIKATNKPLIYCCCGCGSIIPKYNKKGEELFYVTGHKPKTEKHKEKISKSLKKYRRKHKFTPEHKEKIREAGLGRVVREETKDKLSKASRGVNNWRYRGGILINKDGYTFILIEDKNHPSFGKYVRVHRYIVEKFIVGNFVANVGLSIGILYLLLEISSGRSPLAAIISSLVGLVSLPSLY